jgi:hypothetical protein
VLGALDQARHVWWGALAERFLGDAMLTQIAHARAMGSVHERAIVRVARAVLPRVPDAFLFLADSVDPTARELLATYAEERLTELQLGNATLVALSRAAGLRLLATPEHRRESSALDEIARTVREHPGRAFVLVVAGGGVLAQTVRLCDDGMVALAAAASGGGAAS